MDYVAYAIFGRTVTAAYVSGDDPTTAAAQVLMEPEKVRVIPPFELPEGAEILIDGRLRTGEISACTVENWERLMAEIQAVREL